MPDNTDDSAFTASIRGSEWPRKLHHGKAPRGQLSLRPSLRLICADSYQQVISLWLDILAALSVWHGAAKSERLFAACRPPPATRPAARLPVVRSTVFVHIAHLRVSCPHVYCTPLRRRGDRGATAVAACGRLLGALMKLATPRAHGLPGASSPHPVRVRATPLRVSGPACRATLPLCAPRQAQPARGSSACRPSTTESGSSFSVQEQPLHSTDAWLQAQCIQLVPPSTAADADAVRDADNIYSLADWANHSSMYRYVRHIETIPKSRTVRKILVPTGLAFLSTLAIVAYDALHPASWPGVPSVSQDVFSLTGPALSLLLVFRTDASYNRWDESRRQFGELIYKSRNLLRQGLVAFPANQEALKSQLVRWTITFGVLLKLHLREDVNAPTLTRELGGWLTPAEIASVAETENAPNYALQVLSHIVRRAPPDERSSLDANLEAFEEVLGRCERINRVPIPLSYTRHTSRFLISWLLLLPLGMWNSVHFEALLFAPLITFLLFGVDQIGVQLEQPFSVLPLDLLVDKIKNNALELVRKNAETYALVLAGAPLEEEEEQEGTRKPRMVHPAASTSVNPAMGG